MALKVSTGLRNGMLVTGSFKSLLDGGFVKIYAGTVPSAADDSLGSATLLCTITKNGDGTTGLTINTVAAAGAVTKAAEVWSGTNAATGTATFWRFVKTGDTGALSTTDVRLQGLAATAGAELVTTSVSLSSGASQTIDYFSVALPAG
jgi:hypothetical protein